MLGNGCGKDPAGQISRAYRFDASFWASPLDCWGYRERFGFDSISNEEEEIVLHRPPMRRNHRVACQKLLPSVFLSLPTHPDLCPSGYKTTLLGINP